MSATEVTTIRLPRHQRDALDHVARQRGLSFSQLMRSLVSSALDQLNGPVPVAPVATVPSAHIQAAVPLAGNLVSAADATALLGHTENRSLSVSLEDYDREGGTIPAAPA